MGIPSQPGLQAWVPFASEKLGEKLLLIQCLLLVPLKGGRWHIIPQLAVYTTYIPLIYCLLGGYMLPTTFQGKQKQPLVDGSEIRPAG